MRAMMVPQTAPNLPRKCPCCRPFESTCPEALSRARDLRNGVRFPGCDVQRHPLFSVPHPASPTHRPRRHLRGTPQHLREHVRIASMFRPDNAPAFFSIKSSGQCWTVRTPDTAITSRSAGYLWK